VCDLLSKGSPHFPVSLELATSSIHHGPTSKESSFQIHILISTFIASCDDGRNGKTQEAQERGVEKRSYDRKNSTAKEFPEP
jgi:hypothetical protein